jgi:flagellar biosynthetic protein FliP
MTTTTGRPPTTAWRHFLCHYLEMIAAMLVGMAVFGIAVQGVLTLAGLEAPGREEWTSLEMAAEMSAGMVIWMRYRGHGWASSLEMTAAMFAPPALLFPLLWAGAVPAGSLMVLEHLVMLPAMFLVMLRRRAEYGGASHV